LDSKTNILFIKKQSVVLKLEYNYLCSNSNERQ